MNEIFHRTSIRNYLDRQIEPKKVEQMLRAAMAAPSAGINNHGNIMSSQILPY